MSAYLTTSYKKGFLLTEEALIKIDDLIRKRLVAADPEAKVIFRVFRTDGMLLEYDAPSEVVAEENAARNAVKKIEIVCELKAAALKMTFDSSESVDLKLRSENRDLAYLLFSDLKEYLTAEVLKFRAFTFDAVLSSRTFLPIVMLLIPLLTLFAVRDAPKPEVTAVMIQSVDIHQKLNYLVQQTTKKDEFGNLKYLVFVMFGVMMIPVFLGSVLDRAFPRNVFY